MKKFTTLIAVAALVAPATVFAATFEGIVKMEMSGQGAKAMPMTYTIKQGFTRIDFELGQGAGAMVIDFAKQQMTMLMPEQKMYMVQPLPKPTDIPGADQKSDANVTKTDEHQKILGYDATKYLVKDKRSTTEVWITDQLGTFAGLGSGGPMGGMGGGRGRKPAGQGWEEAFKGKDAFPLRVVGHGDKGETFRLEAKEIQKQSVPDSAFAPPADYQKFDMGAMMRGMGMPGMPGAGRAPKED